MNFDWILKIYELYIKTFFHDNIIIKWVLKIVLGLIVFALVGEALMVLFAFSLAAIWKYLSKREQKIKLKIRELKKWEIELLRRIEVIYKIEEGIYYIEQDELKEKNYSNKKDYKNIVKFKLQELDEKIERLKENFESGSKIIGAFDGKRIIGMAYINNKFIGEEKDTLQIDILCVSYLYSKKGIGEKLLKELKKIAIEKAAKKLYISSSQSKDIVDFYINNGFKLVKVPDKELFEKEPLDIHLELELEN